MAMTEPPTAKLITSETAEQETEDSYAVYAEARNYSHPLLQLKLTFARLIDDIIVPYQSGEAFFIDGAPLKAKKRSRLELRHSSIRNIETF